MDYGFQVGEGVVGYKIRGTTAGNLESRSYICQGQSQMKGCEML